jgi:hypothetical protein
MQNLIQLRNDGDIRDEVDDESKIKLTGKTLKRMSHVEIAA